MVTFKYILSLWTKKLSGQLMSFLFSIPVILIIMCSVTQMLMPITSSILFENNAQYRYFYKTGYYEFNNGNATVSRTTQLLLDNEKVASLLYIKETPIFYGYDASLSIKQDRYYDTLSIVDLYIAQAGTDLSNTFFTEDNFVDDSTPYHTKFSGKPRIYLSYNTAKYLKVQKGDTIIRTISNDIFECTIAGYLKPYYDGTSEGNTYLKYNQYMSFPALLVVDGDLFDKITASDYTYSLVAFSDDQIEGAESAMENTKEEKLKMLKDVLTKKKIILQFVLQFLFSVCVVSILLMIEFNFIRKKNVKDFKILGMLGMKKRGLKQILAIHVWISYVITLLVSYLICRFVYFDRLLKMYCETSVLLWTGLAMLITGTMIVILRSLFIKKTI